MARSKPSSDIDTDRGFMQLALRVARRMLGRTAPNPAVGAVVADQRIEVAQLRGWPRKSHFDGLVLSPLT